MTTQAVQPDCTIITNTARRVLQVDPREHGRVVVTAMDKATGKPYRLSIGYDELEALAHTLLMYKSQPGRKEAYESMLADRQFKAEQAWHKEWEEDRYRYGSDD